jgi:hypothetical protein
MFNVNKCASAIAAAMVGTIRTGDDASRFSQRAMAEGFTNISDLIAADAVKQALAIREAINKADPLINQTSYVLPSAKTADTNVFKEGFDEVEGFGALRLPSEVAFADSPLTAPAPPAPELAATTSTSTTMGYAGSVDVDSEGLPWDGRIHSSNKKKLAKDDTWQLRRGIGAAIVEQVKAELRQVMAIPKPDASFATAPAEASSPANSGYPAVNATEQVTSAPPPPVETQGLHPEINAFSTATVNKLVEAGNTVPTVAAGTPQTGASSKPYAQYELADLMRALTSKRVTTEQVLEAANMFLPDGATFPSLPSLAPRKDIIPLVAEALQL